MGAGLQAVGAADYVEGAVAYVEDYVEGAAAFVCDEVCNEGAGPIDGGAARVRAGTGGEVAAEEEVAEEEMAAAEEEVEAGEEEVEAGGEGVEAGEEGMEG